LWILYDEFSQADFTTKMLCLWCGGFMDTAQLINDNLTTLSPTLQSEVLDFIEYLRFKNQVLSKVEQPNQESLLSLNLAMRGMEDEKTPLYTVEDLREKF